MKRKKNKKTSFLTIDEVAKITLEELYQKKVKLLQDLLNQFSLAAEGVEKEMIDGARIAIEELEKIQKYCLSDRTAETPKNQVSYEDANELLDEIEYIGRMYLTIKNNLAGNPDALLAATNEMKQRCNKLGKKADDMFSHQRAEKFKKIMMGVALFVGAGLVIAGIVTMVLASHGSMLGLIPVLIPAVVGSIQSIKTLVEPHSNTIRSVAAKAIGEDVNDEIAKKVHESAGNVIGNVYQGGKLVYSGAREMTPASHVRMFAEKAMKATKKSVKILKKAPMVEPKKNEKKQSKFRG